MIKTITTLCFILSLILGMNTTLYAAKTLTRYQDLQQALMQGDTVKMIIDSSKCSPAIPGMAAGFILSPFFISQGKIMHVLNTFMQDKDGTFIKENNNIFIAENGSVTILHQTINPVANVPTKPTFTITCNIANGSANLIDAS